MNLFTINTIFIALATFIVLKVLRFPMLKYANSKKRKRIAQFASLAAILVMIYPTITFLRVLKNSGYEGDYTSFIKTEIEPNNDLWFQKGILDTENKTVTLYFNGEIPQATETDLRNEIKQYDNLSDFDLKVNGNKNRSFDKISDAYDRAISDLDEKDNIISGLQKEIENLKGELVSLNEQNSTYSFSVVCKDAKIQFQELDYFGLSKMLVTSNFNKIDTIDVVSARWKNNLVDSLESKRNVDLINWLKPQIKADSIVLKND